MSLSEESATEVIPLNYYDGNLLMQTMVCHTMIVFNSHLNPERLQSGLCHLAEKDGWGKIGARLTRRWDGQLEYHIPRKFTVHKPAIMFSQEQHDMDMKDHAAASQIPRPTGQPSVAPASEALGSRFRHQDVPKSVHGYVGANIPQVALHVACFNDATIISISWPHTFCDGMAMSDLIRSWTLMLRDPGIKIQPPYGIASNPLSKLGQNPTEPCNRLGDQMSSWQKLKSICRNLPEYLFQSRVNRVVCVPSSFIASLREQALKDICHIQNATTSFLSENDILFAWWARVVLSRSRQNPNQTLNLVTTASRRAQLAKDLLPPDSIYLSNAIGFLQTLIAKADLLEEPIGYTAYRIRQTIQSDNTREQIEAHEALTANSRVGLPIFLGDSSTQVLLSTSLIKGNMYDFDFSYATKKDIALDPSHATTPSYIHTSVSDGLYHLITPICIFLGKDPKGNYWISASLSKNTWNHVEATLSESAR